MTANPYSSEHPAPPHKFAGRKNQLSDYRQFLDDTIGGNSKNIAVLGEWGIGKTSLLWMFKQLAEERGCAGTIIELGDSIDSFRVLFETITRNLARDSQHKKSLSRKAKEFLSSISISVGYAPIGVSYTKKAEVIPDTIKFKDDLTAISRHIESPFLIMLDNAECLLNVKGALFELRNVFQTLQSMDNVKCMLILAGSEQLFSDIRSVSEPATRFFWGVALEPFTPDETAMALSLPLRNTRVRYSDECIERIHKLTQGHPFFVQVFAYQLFNLRKGNTIDVDDIDKNYLGILTYFGKRLFDTIYSQLSDNERKIVDGICKSDEETLDNVRIAELSGIHGANPYIKRLYERKPSVLIKIERGQYRLFHPLFREYLIKAQKATR